MEPSTPLSLQERDAAQQLFTTAEGVPVPSGKTFEPGEGLAAADALPAEDGEEGGDAAMAENGVAEKAAEPMSLAQKTAIEAAIANAATLEEVSRLEKALATGQMPSEIQVGGLGFCHWHQLSNAVARSP